MSTETGPLLWSTANHKVGIFTFEHSCHKPSGVSKLKPRRFHGRIGFFGYFSLKISQRASLQTPALPKVH